MPSTDAAPGSPPALGAPDRQQLLALARASISHAVTAGDLRPLTPTEFPPALQQRAASFVSLHRAGDLRGCIGHLEAKQALCLDVNENAFAAATRDTRFHPIAGDELASLEIEISVLSTPRPLPVDDENALLEALRPGIDGLILQAGRRRATFLPAVWRSLPEPAQFVAQLKAKAGLPLDFWSDDVECLTYQASCFGE